jgi:hypothetical protein
VVTGRRIGARPRTIPAVAGWLLVPLSCGGISERSAGDSGSASDDDAGARGGRATSGGTGSSTGGNGGTAMTGGRGGSVAGSSPTGGAGNTGPNCQLEPLSQGTRCDTGAAYAENLFYDWYAPVGNFSLCQEECLARPGCTAVVAYPDISDPRFTCYVYTTSCDNPSTGDWYEEDAGKDYRKVCDENGRCSFDYVGDLRRCENPDAHEPVPGATSRDDCEAACMANPDCTAITDYFWLNDVGGCYLFSGACEGTGDLPPGDEGVTYRKACGEGGNGAGGTPEDGGEGGGGTNDPNPPCGVGVPPSPLPQLFTQAALEQLRGVSVLYGTLYLESRVTDLSPLRCLRRIEGDFVASAVTSLETLRGLERLWQVTGNVEIFANPVLWSVDGLDALDTAGGALRIGRNPELLNLHALASLTRVGAELAVYENPQLPTCDATLLRDQVGTTNIGGFVDIRSNLDDACSE